MEKIITTRFAGKCVRCGQGIAAGSRAVWLGGKRGVRHHPQCSPDVPPKLEKPRAQPESEEITLEYSEVVSLFRRAVKSSDGVYTQARNRPILEALKSSWNDASWAGASYSEMEDFLSRGYRVPGLDVSIPLISGRPRRKLVFGEDGDELLIDLVYQGSDAPFQEWEKRIGKPGLRVEVWTTFSAFYPERTIAAYERWVARALQAIDDARIDMEISVVVRTSRADTEKSGMTHTTKIRVRKAGEAADFSNWSAMFSPSGFRHLGILATGIHVDRKGGYVSHGYGAPRDYGKWEVAYDETENVLVIGNSNSEYDFPEFEMTEKLKAVLGKIEGH